MIFIERDTPPSRQTVQETVQRLGQIAAKNDSEAVRHALAEAIPVYRDAAFVNSKATESREMQMV